MAENMSRTEKSTLKDTVKQEDEEERRMVSEEVEKLVKGELEKLEVESKWEKSRKGLTLKFEEKPEGKAEKDHVTFQDEEEFRFTEGSDWAKKAKKDWDTLTLQDEPGSISDDGKEPEGKGRGFLAWQVKGEATMGEEKPTGEEDLLPVAEEEEDVVKTSEEVGQEKEKEAPNLHLRVPGTGSTSLWSRYRDRIKQTVQNQKLSFPRFNYFTRVFSQESSSVKIKSKEEFPEFESRSWDHEPMLSRLFSIIPCEGPTKKFTLRWPPEPPYKESRSSRLTTIRSSEYQDNKASEHDLDPEMKEVCSRSPDSLLAKSHETPPEIYSEPEMEETEAIRSHSKLLQSDSLYSYHSDGTAGPDHTSSVWSMGQRISHWRMTHNRVVQAEKNAQEKTYKQRLLKHERDTKAAVPLPLQEKIEEEILIILMDTFRDYQLKIGQKHPLTIQMEEKIDEIHFLLQARGAI